MWTMIAGGTQAKEIAFAFMTEGEDDQTLKVLHEVFDTSSGNLLNVGEILWIA